MLFFVITGGMFVGCQKFLDIKPKGITIPDKLDDYERIMNDDLTYWMGHRFPSYMTDNVLLGSGGMSYSYQTIPGDSYRRIYAFEHGDIFEQVTNKDLIYAKCYKNIFNYNVVINNVMDIDDAPDNEKRRLRAEALVGRAMEYLYLVSIYGKAYDPLTAETDLTVPLNLTEDVAELNYQQATVAEVYAQILSDLEHATPDLSESPSTRFRASKSAVHALKSKVYLNMGDYPKSLEEAKTTLEMEDSLVDLTQYGLRPGNLRAGRIARLPNRAVVYPELNDNPQNIFIRLSQTAYDLNAFCYVTDELLELYEKDLAPGEADKRRELWYIEDQFLTLNFPGYTMFVEYVRPNFGLTTMEVMLTAAECHARAGSATDLVEASLLYNRLRRNRIENYTDVSFANAEEALVKVLEERRRELGMIGNHRFTDLKRLNLDPRFAKSIVHTADGNTWTLPPNDPRWVFPIPPDARALSPGLDHINR